MYARSRFDVSDGGHILLVASVLSSSKIAVRVVWQSPSAGYAGSLSAKN
jgi:hypothetical protein